MKYLLMLLSLNSFAQNIKKLSHDSLVYELEKQISEHRSTHFYNSVFKKYKKVTYDSSYNLSARIIAEYFNSKKILVHGDTIIDAIGDRFYPNYLTLKKTIDI